jgi:hypothetical protein
MQSLPRRYRQIHRPDRNSSVSIERHARLLSVENKTDADSPGRTQALEIQLLHGVRSELNSELLLEARCLAQTISVLFAQKYGKAGPAIASTMLVSTVGMIAALCPSRLYALFRSTHLACERYNRI